jgi:hypothetical protein
LTDWKKKVKAAAEEVWKAERTKLIDHRGGDPAMVPALVRESNLVKFDVDDEDRILKAMASDGMEPMPQYETVKNSQENVFVLETQAHAVAAPGESSASVARDTTFHRDTYQYKSPYRGIPIAGIGQPQSYDVLVYPKVVEGRFLVFADMAEATRRLMMSHESSLLLHLMKPKFEIDGRYVATDADLDDPGPIAILFKDSLGYQFTMGGSITSKDPMAAFTLSLLRSYLNASVITERLESGVGYLVNSRLVVHRGIRMPGIDGQTLLRRVLLGSPAGTQ